MTRKRDRPPVSFLFGLPVLSYNTVMPNMPLALVTGAAHRLGRVFAETLAHKGYAIALHYNRSREKAEQAAEEIRRLGVAVYPIPAELDGQVQVEALFRQIDGLQHPLRVLVNSAAVMPRGSLRDLSLEAWEATLRLNLSMPFLLAQQAARRMDTGLIVNITDIGAKKAWTGFPAYTVSKAALESLTRLQARTYAPAIRVNAIAPGLALQAQEMPDEEWNRLAGRLPIPRAARPQELAAALEFLLENEYITGQSISVDGGYSLI